LTIYPNPANESVKVSFDNTLGGLIDIKLIDQFGRIIMTENNIQSYGLTVFTIDLVNLSEGMYTVQLASNQNTISKRLIVRK
ncbi:MAG: T9SS type A sorting domain-containing protein, partial [Crocinitomicaceae bacterium]